MAYTLTVKQKFDAAHHLDDYDGDCANLHGHTWTVEVVIEGDKLDDLGMLADFKLLKAMMKKVLPDHRYLNEIFPDFNPTAENLSRHFFIWMRKELEGLEHDYLPGKVKLKAVRVWESENASCEYSEGQ